MHDTTTISSARNALAQRHRRRCLDMSPDDTAHGEPVRDDFWHRRSCDAALLPPQQRAT